ncbi:hypothetical protein ACFQ05_37195 [Amycolatopsis umgeniensis]|uniref:Uncharacterized protein n=1 Tax=Amycolatopsis umgeniensis TaxID=336628 RepID=A0A841AWN0_9PSEU|nr:hypothetical protein [Amycolatopsis umgeniensis]MBB5851061.1 hypothetical protein [Amycolatopsis umgeniensis]
MTLDPLISVSSTGRFRRFRFSYEIDEDTADSPPGDALADLLGDAAVDTRINFGNFRNIARSISVKSSHNTSTSW